MTLEVLITHDLPSLERRLDLYPKELLQADVRARNRSMVSAKADAAKRMSPDLGGIKVGTIKFQIKQKSATQAAPLASLEFSNKRFRLFGNFNLKLLNSKYGTGVRLGRMPYRLEFADGTAVTDVHL